ncbi:MAG: hypothetical protein WA792_10570 [Pseudolabrys sp.]|jgi:hypothetical protein
MIGAYHRKLGRKERLTVAEGILIVCALFLLGGLGFGIIAF